MMDFIERLRAKPEHVRRRIALAASAGVTAVVALLWLIAISSSGVLALGSGSSSDSTLTSAFSGKAGSTASAFSAAAALFGGASGDGIEVVGTESSSTLDERPAEERTVIPF